MIRIILILILVLVGCGIGNPQEKLFAMYHKQVSSVGDITDEMVGKYIKTYGALRKNGHNYLDFLARGGAGGEAGFNKFEADIKKGGFKDYAEFVKVNAKIAWAWNMAQASRGLEKQKDLQKWGQSGLDAGIAEIQKHINDPNVPEETKKGLRKQIEELRKGKKKLKNAFDKNMKWADWAMNFVKPLTNDKDIKVIIRHEKELMQVFTGLSKKQLDQIQEQSMKQLKIQ